MAKQQDWLKKALAAGVVAASAMGWHGNGQAGPVTGQGTWETTLQARDLDNNGVTDAFYDTALNITWLRNANINGAQNWSTAVAWADNLVFGGYSDWRLPTMVDTGTAGCNFAFTGTDCGYNVQTKVGSTAYSEMAHLFYVTLGNKASFNISGSPQSGDGLSNTGDFENLQSALYWSGLDSGPRTAWYFGTDIGNQSLGDKDGLMYALAVRSGDVAAQVPEPGTWALLGLALAGVGVARRRPR